MDILTDILSAVRVQSSLFFRSNQTGGWGSHYLPVDHPVFHCVLDGEAWVCLDGEEDFKLYRKGDVCVLPAGASHFIGHAPRRDYPIREVCLTKGCGSNEISQENATVRLLCGVFQSDGGFDHPVFTTLPDLMFVEGSQDDQKTGWISHAAFAIDHALDNNQPGSRMMMDRLLEVLFVQLIQGYLYNNNQQETLFLQAMNNPSIRRVLEAIHQQPESTWTLQRMASLAHQSRTTFNSHFRENVGIPPMNYLANWRMRKAKLLLKETSLPMSRIAEKVGYASPSSFNKVFKKHFGKTPSDIRLEFAV